MVENTQMVDNNLFVLSFLQATFTDHTIDWEMTLSKHIVFNTTHFESS